MSGGLHLATSTAAEMADIECEALFRLRELIMALGFVHAYAQQQAQAGSMA